MFCKRFQPIALVKTSFWGRLAQEEPKSVNRCAILGFDQRPWTHSETPTFGYEFGLGLVLVLIGAKCCGKFRPVAVVKTRFWERSAQEESKGNDAILQCDQRPWMHSATPKFGFGFGLYARVSASWRKVSRKILTHRACQNKFLGKVRPGRAKGDDRYAILGFFLGQRPHTHSATPKFGMGLG